MTSVVFADGPDLRSGPFADVCSLSPGATARGTRTETPRRLRALGAGGRSLQKRLGVAARMHLPPHA